jgi:hypothetical protein
MKALLTTATLVALFALASPAAASEYVEPTRRTESSPREWYGWQLLTSDAATLVTTTLLLGSFNDESYGQLNFAAGYLVGGPTIHVAHGNYGTAFGSLVLRAGLPTAGALVGCAAYGDNQEVLGCLPGAALGLVIGMGGAIALDAGVLAYRDEKPRPKTFEVMPSASLSRTGATFGLQGSF